MNAQEWLARGGGPPWDVAVVGAPIARASISPSGAWATPPAFRAALARFATWDSDHGVDLEPCVALDRGDVEGDAGEPDARAAHERIRSAVAGARDDGARCVAVIGGDNSLTLPAMRGISDDRLGDGWGLLTLDAHHDVRPRGEDGLPRNGTPVRDLVELGLPGERVAQLGLHGFANAREHARWAAAQGVHAWSVDRMRREGAVHAVGRAVATLARHGASRLYVDLDIDVLDRAYAPACPASMPGGLTPGELQEVAFALGRTDAVAAVDLTEVDASADVAAMTVRAMASVFLAFCAGVAARGRDR